VLSSGFSAARKVSLANDIEPPPRQHPLPCDYLSVYVFYTCCWCTLRYDDDDFEACSTAAMIDHRREHRGCRTPKFPLMPATICRLMPPRTMRGSGQARIADHDHWSRCRPTC